jgi:diadenosine tetraphosphatase ApaH/serine/threonine PP2A family protein phosphatase
LGEEVWEEVNLVFDALPLAAVVDNKIFCIHGGIPSFENLSDDELNGSIELINQIKCPLKDPENECPLAWELLWNDPYSLVTF